MPHTPEMKERNDRIMQLLAKGWTQVAVAREMGLSQQRIWQIREKRRREEKRQRIYDILSSPNDSEVHRHAES